MLSTVVGCLRWAVLDHVLILSFSRILLDRPDVEKVMLADLVLGSGNGLRSLPAKVISELEMPFVVGVIRKIKRNSIVRDFALANSVRSSVLLRPDLE